MSHHHLLILTLLTSIAIAGTVDYDYDYDYDTLGRIVQITDPHVDNLYTPGTFSDCAALECCRPDSYTYKHSDLVAGPQGDYHCCPPPWTLRAATDFAASLLQGDGSSILIYSGDSPQKDFLNMTETDILMYIGVVTKTIKASLSAASVSAHVVPIIGNHDTYPIDQLPLPPESDWLLNGAESAWNEWLSNYPSAASTFHLGGYYAAEFEEGNLRILNLNSLWYDPYNFFVSTNVTGPDPTGQWSWLISQLDRARVDGAKVIVHAHIPPNTAECTRKASSRWCEMASQYSDVIIAHMFGHVHNDLISLFHDNNNGIIGAAYQAPSVTTTAAGEFSIGLNPSVRIYYYDRKTLELVDYDQYRCDLSTANVKNQTCHFTHAYRFSTEFNTPTPLNAANLAMFWSQMNSNETVFNNFFKAYSTGHDGEGDGTGFICEGKCRTAILCDVEYTDRVDYLKCHGQS